LVVIQLSSVVASFVRLSAFSVESKFPHHKQAHDDSGDSVVRGSCATTPTNNSNSTNNGLEENKDGQTKRPRRESEADLENECAVSSSSSSSSPDDSWKEQLSSLIVAAAVVAAVAVFVVL
jgi:hypothetical protein